MSEGRRSIVYLDLDDLFDVILFATGTTDVIRDVGLVESAVHRPSATAFGEDAYVTLHAKAAALLESLIRNDALVDGNKRTSWLAAWLFLRLNGVGLQPPPADAFDLVMAIAEGQVELDEIALRLSEWSSPAD